MTPRDSEARHSLSRQYKIEEASAVGHLIVVDSVANATLAALRGFGGPDGRHEGVVFWMGRQDGEDFVVTTAEVPAATHGRGYFNVSRSETARMLASARRRRTAFMAQVHSHPGRGTEHSDGDDEFAFMPREGMFSIVVASYGDGGITAAGGAGIHQFQSSVWKRVTNPDNALMLVPSIAFP